MANLPDFLYKLTERDQQVTPIEIVLNTANNSAAGTQLQIQIYTVPKGKILLLETVGVFAIPGTSQYLVNWGLVVSNGAQSCIVAGSQNPVTTSLSYKGGQVFGPMSVGEGSILTVNGIFNAGANSNSFTAAFSGILIPRGNYAI